MPEGPDRTRVELEHRGLDATATDGRDARAASTRRAAGPGSWSCSRRRSRLTRDAGAVAWGARSGGRGHRRLEQRPGRVAGPHQRRRRTGRRRRTPAAGRGRSRPPRARSRTRAARPSRPCARSSASRMSDGNGIIATTSSIGASISASITENSPSVNSSPGRGPAQLLAGALAEAGAHQRGHGQLGRLAVDARQHGQRRPAPQVLHAEERERLADRADLEAQPEEGRVDVAQQAEAQPDVATDQALELMRAARWGPGARPRPRASTRGWRRSRGCGAARGGRRRSPGTGRSRARRSRRAPRASRPSRPGASSP